MSTVTVESKPANAQEQVVALVRAHHGLSQKEMGDRIGCSAGHVSWMERRNALPTQRHVMQSLVKLAAEAGIEFPATEEDSVVPTNIQTSTRRRRFKVAEPAVNDGGELPSVRSLEDLDIASSIISRIESSDVIQRLGATAELAQAGTAVRMLVLSLVSTKLPGRDLGKEIRRSNKAPSLASAWRRR